MTGDRFHVVDFHTREQHLEALPEIVAFRPGGGCIAAAARAVPGVGRGDGPLDEHRSANTHARVAGTSPTTRGTYDDEHERRRNAAHHVGTRAALRQRGRYDR